MRALVYIISLMFWVVEDEVEQPEMNNMELELEKMYQMWYEQQTKIPEPADNGLSFISQNAVFLSIFLLLPLLSYKKWSNRYKIQTPDLGFDAEDCLSKLNKEQEIIQSNQWKGLLKIRRKSQNMKPRRSKTVFAFCSMKCVAFAVDILRRWRKRTEHKSRAVYKQKKQQPVTAKKKNNKPKIDFKKLVKKLLLCKKKKWLSKKKYASHEIRPTVSPRPSAYSESIKCVCPVPPAMKTPTYPAVYKKKKQQPVTAKKRNNKPKIDFKKLVKKLLLCKKKKWLSKKKYASLEIIPTVSPRPSASSESIKCVCPVPPALKTPTYKPVFKSSMLSKGKIKKLELHTRSKYLAIRFKLFPEIFLESRRMYRRSLLKSSASKKVFFPPARITSKPHYYRKRLHTKELLSTSTGRVHEEDWKEKFNECLGGMKEQLTLWFQSMKKTLNNCMK